MSAARQTHAILVLRLPWRALALLLGGGLVAWWLVGCSDGPSGVQSIGTRAVDWTAFLDDPDADQSFARPSGPWQLHLPADHGAHPKFRSESWLLSGTMVTAQQERLGFQLALLRFALVPEESLKRDSTWRTAEVYRAHLLLADDASGVIDGEERYSRAAVGLAGHDEAKQRVWLEDWAFEYGVGKRGEQVRIVGKLEESALNLLLRPTKAPVTGNQEQNSAPFRGFALTRLEGDGVVRGSWGEEQVTASAWLEHLWGEVPLPVGPIVWDRAQIQLDDGTEVFVLRSRRRDGRGQPTLSGYRLDAAGRFTALDPESSRFMPDGEYWKDERTDTRYPLSWRLTAEELDLQIGPLLEAQGYDFAVPFWSGSVRVHGRSAGAAVSGTGFLELTGYESGE